jgi:hypothetical protein
VRTLVVPEGGELPPEEELAAMAAAEEAANAPAADEAVLAEAEAAGVDAAIAAAAAEDFEPADEQQVDETAEPEGGEEL